MKRILLVAAISVAVNLAGCASVTPNNEDQIWGSLQQFQGQDIRRVGAVFGLPDSQRIGLAGEKVYRWTSRRNYQTDVPIEVRTRGSVGDALWGRVPYEQTSQATVQETREWICFLDVGVDETGRVIGLGFNGNMGACQAFYVPAGR